MKKKNQWSAVLQNQVVAIVLALIVLVPLLFAGAPVHRGNQMVAFGFLGLLLFVVWLFRAQERVTLQQARAFLTSGPNLPLVLYLGWGLLSVFLSIDQVYSQFAFIQLGFGVLVYAMVVYQFRHRAQLRTLLSSILAVGVLLVLGAFVLDADRKLMDLSGSFHDRQLFGAFLGLLLPVLVGVAAGSRKSGYKLAAQVSAVLLAGALLLTRCRSSWLGVLVALSVFLVLTLVFVWKWQNVKRRKHELLITPALAIVALAIFVVFSRMGGPLQWRTATFGNLAQDASVVDRLNLWQVAVDAVEARPITGWGLGTYALAQIPFAQQSRGEAIIRNAGPALTESPHNLYLQVAAEQGVVGLLLYLGVLLFFFRYGIRAIPRMERGLRQYTLIGCLAAVAGQSVDALANPGWTFPEVSMFFWLILGLGMSAAGLGQEVVAEAQSARGEEPVLGIPRFLYRGARTALIGCGTLVLGAQLLNLSMVGTAFAQVPDYPPVPPPGGGGGEEGLSTAEQALIAAGGAAGGLAIAGAAGVGPLAGVFRPGGMESAFPCDQPHECRERYPDLPEGHTQFSAVRVAPTFSTLRPGFGRCFHLEVLSSRDNMWYSVTNLPGTTIQLSEPTPCLEQREGARSVFCVPKGAPADCDGKSFTVVGTYTPSGGGGPVTARAQVKVRVPGRN